MHWFFKNRNSKVYPAYWERYKARFEQEMPANTPIEALEFIVLDLETTGLNVKKDNILSVGAIRVADSAIYIAEHLDFRMAQSYTPDESSIAVHGLLPVEKEGDLLEIEGIKRILEFLGNRIVVGHHIGFDRAMLNRILKVRVGETLQNKFLDTATLASRLRLSNSYSQRQLGLDQLCKEYQIPLNDRHTAAGDAFLTAVLFLKLLQRLESRGVKTLKQLMRRIRM